MGEQLVTFETAKLAKEKGFNIRVLDYYSNSIEPISSQVKDMEAVGFRINKYELLRDFNSNYLMDIRDSYSAPTQSLLQKWLREKHNMLIGVYSNASGYDWEHMDAVGGTHRANGDFGADNESGYWETYEEALEQGLIYALKLIK